jgi:cyclic pyranopterin phosphate synthase
MRDSLERTIDTLRLSVTDRCNLRCIYCMPEQGIPLVGHSDVLSVEETVELAGILIDEAGLRRVRITGGEPLVRKGLLEIIRGIAMLDLEELTLTTNGVLLAAQAAHLAEAGVKRVNVSLDSLRDDRLALITRRAVSLGAIEEAIDASFQAGLAPVKVNCVVLRGVNEDEITDFLLWGRSMGVTVRFIEHMPAMLSPESFVPAGEILARISELGPVRTGELDGGAASRYFLEGTDIRFGVIAPISEPMCSSCRRVRLTADGKLVPCLASVDSIPLKDLLRRGSISEIRHRVRESIHSKPESHGGCSGVSMWKMGG